MIKKSMYHILGPDRKPEKTYITGQLFSWIGPPASDPDGEVKRRTSENPLHAVMIAHGFFKEVQAVCNENTHRIIDTFSVDGETCFHDTIELSPSELEAVSMETWQKEMFALDSQITMRMVEDIFDLATGATTDPPQQLKDLMAARKNKRSQKPDGR